MLGLACDLWSRTGRLLPLTVSSRFTRAQSRCPHHPGLVSLTQSDVRQGPGDEPPPPPPPAPPLDGRVLLRALLMQVGAYAADAGGCAACAALTTVHATCRAASVVRMAASCDLLMDDEEQNDWQDHSPTPRTKNKCSCRPLPRAASCVPRSK